MLRKIVLTVAFAFAVASPAVRADEADVRLDIQQLRHELQTLRHEMRTEFRLLGHSLTYVALLTEQQNVLLELRLLDTIPNSAQVQREREKLKQRLEKSRKAMVQTDLHMEILGAALDGKR